MIAHFCRYRYVVSKGKINIELVELSKRIQYHQKETLGANELKEAVEYAGVAVPEGA
jgi:hypothetical protein